ncbi:hypothetical protein CAPTEDRAFT_223706 [Capitella teleta]|uniref:Programmed cell death protein 5 n=1 Tax=Capitella teleta TaxID=283909 RepID=R7UJ78_CAPTE|nr:hypothetical protein CAPTEDRAFT_223706 [Capitella teleta]|eukprot:ELU06260.1 hypothetical protein CAPTEDRAFT_223706 [Capitella teleta]
MLANIIYFEHAISIRNWTKKEIIYDKCNMISLKKPSAIIVGFNYIKFGFRVMPGNVGPGGKGPSPEEQAAMKQQQDQMKNNILAQVLDQPARARLNTIGLTKPEKVQMVENMLIQMARSGQIQERLGEAQLKGLLERVSEKSQKVSSVKFDRRRAALDDSDED